MRLGFATSITALNLEEKFRVKKPYFFCLPKGVCCLGEENSKLKFEETTKNVSFAIFTVINGIAVIESVNALIKLWKNHMQFWSCII